MEITQAGREIEGKGVRKRKESKKEKTLEVAFKSWIRLPEIIAGTVIKRRMKAKFSLSVV